jgi:nitrite reductase/ring-hydroxylating ferredoxin subunit
MSFIRVANVEEILPGTARRVPVAGRTVAIFNLGGAFYALDDRCPHEGGFLSLGATEDRRVNCPVHGATFDLRTGQALEPPAGESTLTQDVRAYRTRVVGTEVEVDIEEQNTGEGGSRGIQTVLEL